MYIYNEEKIKFWYLLSGETKYKDRTKITGLL